MGFESALKGISGYIGLLAEVCSIVERKWGSTEADWEKGVKLYYLRHSRPYRRRSR